jgi:hypothetical protein
VGEELGAMIDALSKQAEASPSEDEAAEGPRRKKVEE